MGPRVAVIANCSGNGKTTFGHTLAAALEVPFVELDELVHGPNWAETPDEELRARLEPIVSGPGGWVIDGRYRRKIGDMVLERADTVVWLDLPMRVWLPRLARRTWRRMRGRESLWNGNTESLRHVIFGWDSLFVYALRMHFRHRHRYPHELAHLPVLRLRTPREVDAALHSLADGLRGLHAAGRGPEAEAVGAEAVGAEAVGAEAVGAEDSPAT